MALMTCPDCAKEVSDQAPVCPHCGRPLRTPQVPQPAAPLEVTVKRKTSRATWGCLLLIALGVIAVLIEQKTTGPQSAPVDSQRQRKTDPKTGQRYIAMPSYSVSPATETKPWLHVRDLLRVAPSGVKAELLRQLGANSSPRYDKADTAWEAKAAAGSVRVVVFKGTIVGVEVHFTPAVKDWSVALAGIDLQPCATPPTTDATGAVHWTRAFDGIDEVWALHEPVGNPSVGSIGVTPNESLAAEFNTAATS